MEQNRIDIVIQGGDWVNSSHPIISIYILHTVLYTFPKVFKMRILFTNQELYYLVIISFILVTLLCDSGVIWYGEIRYQSLLRSKRHSKDTTVNYRLHCSPCNNNCSGFFDDSCEVDCRVQKEKLQTGVTGSLWWEKI